jgi:RimJ/RimL family protein N-acetyltransferase
VIELQAVTLEKYGIRLEPLGPEHHEGLRLAAIDGKLWELRYTSVPEPDRVGGYIEAALVGKAEGHMLPWAVRELATSAIVGSTRYHDVLAHIDRVEIGYTWYASSWQRTHVNSACKLILFEHAFEYLGCRVVGLRTDNLNLRSQQAIEQLGARKDGVIRHHFPRRDGTVRDSVMYSVLLSEWPAIKEQLLERLERHRVRS